MIRLQVHLPGQQLVVFNAESTVRNQADRIEAARRTTLTQFFELNALIKSKIDNNQNLEDWERQAYSSKYQDWPEFMTFDKKLKVWKKRSGGKLTIGRMYASSPHQRDRYYLRLLLATLPSWTSFEDTRSVNGVLYNTYKDACARRGLLDDDFE